jgi:hypothetical protein
LRYIPEDLGKGDDPSLDERKLRAPLVRIGKREMLG